MKTKPVMLHRYWFDIAKPVREEGLMEVRENRKLKPYMAIKRISIEEETDRSKILRKICRQGNENFPKFWHCDSNIVVPFYGCVEEETSIYLLEKVMFQDMSSRNAKLDYQGLPVLEKVKAMLNIIDKFIELHRLSIVHSNINPASIMTKYESISDFRLTNFSVADFEGQKFLKGTDGYLPPERYGKSKYKSLLSFNEDGLLWE